MRLYDDLATWWPILAPPELAAGEAAALLGLLQGAAGAVETLLDLGSGVGPVHAHWPDVRGVLVDRSAAMLEVARAVAPGREHVCADLREVRLGRRFDAVLLHDVVMYLLTDADLDAALATARAHLRPGGALLVLPDAVEETWVEGVVSGGGGDGERAAHLTEWHWDPVPGDGLTRVDLSLLVRVAGEVLAVHEHHTLALRSRAQLWGAITRAGLRPVEADPVLAATAGEVFLAVAP